MDSSQRSAIQEAMVRLSDGDRSAFEALFDPLWPIVLAFTRRGVGHEAEDVAQEVFLRICSRIAEFDRSRDAVSWVFGIAGFEVLTHRKRRQRRREVHDESMLAARADSASSQEQRLLDEQLVEALEQAVGRLSHDDRVALGLAHAEPPVDAGAATQRKRRQRALRRLRIIWRTIHGS